MDGNDNGHRSRRISIWRLAASLAVTLILASGTPSASAKDAKSLSHQIKSLKVDPHRIPKRVPHVKPKAKMDGSLRVKPDASTLENRHIPAAVLLSDYLCMWSRDPGGAQPHFMQSGTCSAPRGAHVGDPCQCREHGDQHRGYIDGRVVAGRASGKAPPLH